MGLLALPDEIMIPIARDLTQISDLNAFTQTSRRLYSLFNLELYAHDVKAHQISYSEEQIQRHDDDFHAYSQKQAGQEKVNVPAFLAGASDLGVDARPYVNGDQSLINGSLCFALRWGHDQIVMLLVKHGLSTQQSLDRGKTLLEQAIKHGREAVVRFLIEEGASLRYHQSRRDLEHLWLTPLYLACYYGHVGVARLLLDNGAPVGKYSDFTQLRWCWAIKDGRVDGVRPDALPERLQICKLLSDHGADPRVVDRRQWIHGEHRTLGSDLEAWLMVDWTTEDEDYSLGEESAAEEELFLGSEQVRENRAERDEIALKGKIWNCFQWARGVDD